MVERCAVRAVGIVKSFNKGKWPESVSEWFRVCYRMGATPRVVKPRKGHTASLWDDEGDRVILVSRRPAEKMMRSMAHEVTEHLLRWDVGESEWRVPDSSREACHRVATLVERL